MEIASTNIVLYAVELNTCLISIMKDNQDTKVRKILRSADIRRWVADAVVFRTCLNKGVTAFIREFQGFPLV